MGSQKPYNEGRQTQWRKEKGQTTIYKIHRKLKIEQHEPPKKTGGELRCSGKVSSSCPTMCYSSHKASEKSRMRKGPTCDFDEWNISVMFMIQIPRSG